jgi:hypothetical protein
MSTLTVSIQHCTVLNRALRQDKERKVIQIGKDVVKLSVFEDNLSCTKEKPILKLM